MSKHIFSLVALFAAVLACARNKPENWLEVRSPHFIVLSDASEKQARHVAGQFERMRLVFHALFPQAHVDPGTPIVVLGVKDKKDFQELEPESYLAKGQLDLAGIFMRAPDKNYILLRLDAQGEHPYATVYHEYTHLLSSRAEEWLPLWFNEGLAEFYQTAEIRDREVLLGETSPENLFLLRQQRLLPLPTLFTVDRNSPYYHEENKGSVFYAESWALVHYLQITDRQQNRQRLSDYAKLMSQNVDAVTAATRVFGDLKQLQAALEKYVAQAAFMGFRGPLSTEVDDAAFTVRPLSLTQADAARADFLAYDQRVTDARTLLERVLHDDPNNVSAHETMGYMELRQGHSNDARKWYGQAVKLDSQSFIANYYFAAIAMSGGQLDSESKSQVENSLRAAIKLNPSFAPAFDQLAVFLEMQHKNLEEAHMLDLNAVSLDPGNLRYRLNTASILMQMEHGKDAIAVLQNATKLASSPEEVNSVQNLLESAQQYQAAREQMEQDRQVSRGVQSTFPQAEATLGDAKQLGSLPQALPPPKDEPHGPRRSVKGTIRNVQCSLPAIMRLKVEAEGKTISLRSNNYFKIPFTAVGFTPAGELHPCTELEGMKAHVEFFEASEKAAEGLIFFVELSK
jgi:Tfp pilus assembly protein PilF